jgi:hypothetical protein
VKNDFAVIVFRSLSAVFCYQARSEREAICIHAEFLSLLFLLPTVGGVIVSLMSFLSLSARAAYRLNTSLIICGLQHLAKKSGGPKKGGPHQSEITRFGTQNFQSRRASDRLRVIFKSFARKFIEPPRLEIAIVNSGHAIMKSDVCAQ